MNNLNAKQNKVYSIVMVIERIDMKNRTLSGYILTRYVFELNTTSLEHTVHMYRALNATNSDMKQERIHGTVQRFYKLISPPPIHTSTHTITHPCVFALVRTAIPFSTEKVLVHPYTVCFIIHVEYF